MEETAEDEREPDAEPSGAYLPHSGDPAADEVACRLGVCTSHAPCVCQSLPIWLAVLSILV